MELREPNWAPGSGWLSVKNLAGGVSVVVAGIMLGCGALRHATHQDLGRDEN